MIATYPQGCSNIEQPFFNKKTASIVVTAVLLLHGIAFLGLANITIPEAKPLKTIPRLEILFSKMPPPEVAPPEIQTVAMKPETIKPDTIKSEPIEKSAESKAKPTSNIQPKPIKEVVEPTPTATPPAVKSTPHPTAIPPINTPVVKPTITPIATPSATTSVVQPAKPTVTPPVTTLANKPTITPITTPPATTSVVKPTAKPTLTPPTNNPVVKPTTATPPNSPSPTEPVILSSGQAHWKSKPPFNCGNNDTGGQTLSGMIRYSVNAQGNITNSSLVKSTGNRKVDNEVSRQARSAKFFPYTKNGVAVASTVNFPFTISCS